MSRLQALTTTEEISIRGRQTENKVPNQQHVLLNKEGKVLFYVGWNRKIIKQCCCGNVGTLDVFIYDSNLKQAMIIRKPRSKGLLCKKAIAEAFTPDNTCIGTIKGTRCNIDFLIFKTSTDLIYKVEFEGNWYVDFANYKLVQKDRNMAGNIMKYKDYDAMMHVDGRDIYKITFPKDADAETRGIIVGVSYLIDFIQFYNPIKEADISTRRRNYTY